MPCDEVRTALDAFGVCTETEEGSRVATHCVYPSFDPVHVFVVRYGDGFRVHDGGGALRAAWLHGREEANIRRMIAKQAVRFQVRVLDDAIVADAPSAEWLTSAILSVANASAWAAHAICVVLGLDFPQGKKGGPRRGPKLADSVRGLRRQ